MAERVFNVRHGYSVPDDRVVRCYQAAGYETDTRKPFRGKALGAAVEELAASSAFGGLFNSREVDHHTFLLEGYRWFDACLKAWTPMLGICRGCQQIARHMGTWAGLREAEQNAGQSACLHGFLHSFIGRAA